MSKKKIRTNIRIYSDKKTIQMNIWIYLYKQIIRKNIWIYLYQKNYMNMIQTNIRIGIYWIYKYICIKFVKLDFKFDVRFWILDVWYNRNLKHSWCQHSQHSWHNKGKVNFLCILILILIFVWTIWAFHFLAHIYLYKKLTKLRRHASRVHFEKILFG